ncbi:MAG: DUF5024 domain-containing protein [Bacteroidaceae bacterium]|nr:DUF5024 domain-containing protein [Bacteroidaceae bacterium]
MKRKLFLFALILLSQTAWAQNAIDDRIDDFKTLGHSEYKSVIERNPETHEPKRMVKNFKVSGPMASSIVQLFKDEAKKSDTENTSFKDGMVSCTFSQDYPESTRIYSITYPKELLARKAEVTVVINYKTNKK